MSNTSLSLNITPQTAIDTQTINAGGTTPGNIIDTQAFESLTLILSSGVITDGTYIPVINESDDPAMAGETAVPADYLVGTIAAASFAAADDNAKKKIGVLNLKRYVTCDYLTTTGGTGATGMGATAILGNPIHANV